MSTSYHLRYLSYPQFSSKAPCQFTPQTSFSNEIDELTFQIVPFSKASKFSFVNGRVTWFSMSLLEITSFLCVFGTNLWEFAEHAMSSYISPIINVIFRAVFYINMLNRSLSWGSKSEMNVSINNELSAAYVHITQQVKIQQFDTTCWMVW